MTKEFADQPDARRYALHVDDELVSVVDYSIRGGAISLNRTYTNPGQRGKGFASDLVDFAVTDAAARGLKVVPMCWYVDEWFIDHPDRAVHLHTS